LDELGSSFKLKAAVLHVTITAEKKHISERVISGGMTSNRII